MNSTAGDGAPRRILIVDDDARLAQIIALQLRLSGAWLLVGVASTAEQALDLAAAEGPDVVLLDLWLHGDHTLGLIAALQALARPPAVVLLTAEPGQGWQERARAAGARAYLSKIEVFDLPAALQAI